MKNDFLIGIGTLVCMILVGIGTYKTLDFLFLPRDNFEVEKISVPVYFPDNSLQFQGLEARVEVLEMEETCEENGGEFEPKTIVTLYSVIAYGTCDLKDGVYNWDGDVRRWKKTL